MRNRLAFLTSFHAQVPLDLGEVGPAYVGFTATTSPAASEVQPAGLEVADDLRANGAARPLAVLSAVAPTATGSPPFSTQSGARHPILLFLPEHRVQRRLTTSLLPVAGSGTQHVGAVYPSVPKHASCYFTAYGL